MNRTPPDDRPGAPGDAELEGLLRDSRTLEDAPEWALRRMLELRPGRAAPPVAPAAPWRRLIASLRFDSAVAAPLALGLRGGGGARQWLFSTEAHDVDVRLANDGLSSGTGWQLSGQVLGPERATQVRLVRLDAEDSTRVQQLSELGDFHIDGLTAGRWRLVIEFGTWCIELPELEWP